MHREECLAAIAAGKHVVCEKPFMVNERETLEVIAAAKEKGVYIIEGNSAPIFAPFSPAKNQKPCGPVSSPWSKISTAGYTRIK